MEYLLTGKCKEAFEKWYIESENAPEWPRAVVTFYQCGFSMQWGAYLEFFDTTNIRIIDSFRLGFFVSQLQIREDGINWSQGPVYQFDIRREAQTKAIEKANYVANEIL